MNEPNVVAGWVDLCLTFGDAGLPVPPIPKSHRGQLERRGEWFWSTRMDINPAAMYLFEYADEVRKHEPKDYSAVSHAGHGINSYSINVAIVKRPIAVMFQHSWGGAYASRRLSDVGIAACFSEMRALINVVPDNADQRSLAHLIEWSNFRGVATYWAKGKNGRWVLGDDDSRRPQVNFEAAGRRLADEGGETCEVACRLFLKNLSVTAGD